MMDLTPRDSRPLTPATLPASGHPAALGFASALQEQTDVALAMEGSMPDWLVGRFIRTVPARFEVGDEAYRHWFDGLAKLCAFQLLGAKGARYRSRFLRSRSYCEAIHGHGVADDSFGTAPHRGPRAAARVLLRGRHGTDNANVHVVRWGERFVALTETPRPVGFDAETLETTRIGYPAGDDLGGSLTTAHPRFDRARNAVFNYETRFGRRSDYVVWALDPQSGRRRVLAELPTEAPCYMHSFGETRDHLVLAEFPLQVDPLALRFTLRAVQRCLRWMPETGLRVRVVSKDDGRVVADRRVDPCFGFHHVHAEDTEAGVTFDLVGYDDPSVIDRSTLSQLRGPAPHSWLGQLLRYRVDWGTAPRHAGLLPAERLSDARLELPRVSPHTAGRSARFVYGVSASTGFLDRLVKVDLRHGDVRAFASAGLCFNEPVFVPRSANGSEDDGVLLCVALEPRRRRSLLLVLDAQRMELCARAPLPEVVPFHFHGDFFAAA